MPESPHEPIDAVILAGGIASTEMAALMGTPVRALFEYHGRTFVEWVYDALRETGLVRRVVIVGPRGLNELPGLASSDGLLPERDTITANLLAGMAAVDRDAGCLITACDNPLLSAAAFRDFLSRVPTDADVAYPILKHEAFLRRFPGASNIPVKLRDGVWIGGCCGLISSRARERMEVLLQRVLAARKSKWKMVRLLGPGFAMRFAAGLVTVDGAEQQASRVAGARVRLICECDPAFAIDLDDPEDWDYLVRWDKEHGR